MSNKLTPYSRLRDYTQTNMIRGDVQMVIRAPVEGAGTGAPQKTMMLAGGMAYNVGVVTISGSILLEFTAADHKRIVKQLNEVGTLTFGRMANSDEHIVMLAEFAVNDAKSFADNVHPDQLTLV